MKIEILYSEVANLFGDMANVRYLEKSLPKAKFIYTSLNDEPKFITEKVNLVYMGNRFGEIKDEFEKLHEEVKELKAKPETKTTSKKKTK